MSHQDTSPSISPKTAMLITGASRGIGRATALLAAKNGYAVCINNKHDADAAERTRADCEHLGATVIAVRADIADAGAVEELFRQCDSLPCPLGVLVNNAGIIGRATRLADIDADTIDETFAVNVRGSMLCAREAIHRLSTDHGGQGGSIINLSSVAARLGSAGEYVHYAASKAAIDTFTIGLAKEVGREGIRVNAVRAGTTDTEIHARAGNPDRPAMVAAQSPLQRVATPEDIAEAIVWLASEKASFVSGALFDVSGGL